MNEELRNLLNRLIDPPEGAEPLSDEELASAREQVLAIAAGVNRDAPTDDDLGVLEEAAGVMEHIDTEQAARTTAAAERAEQARGFLDRIMPAAELSDATPEGEGAEQQPEGADPAAENEAADPHVPGSTDVDGNTVPPEQAETPPADPAHSTQPVAASATPAPRLPSITRLASRTPGPRSARPQVAETGRATLIASGDLPGIQAGTAVDVEEFAEAAMRKYDAIRKIRGGDSDGEKVPFGTIKVQYPEDRILDDNERANEEKFDAVSGPKALAASGGICGPVGVDYTVTSIASADRPVRDGMAQYGATRGGVRYILPHTLSQVVTDGPANVWTNATDTTPGASVKAHATFACQAVQEDTVDAVTSIVQFGNFQARYFPEQIAQYLETVDAVHARVAEANLLAQMVSGSKALVAGNNGTGQTGAASEYLAEMDRAIAAYRYKHRMAADSTLHLWYPEWFEDMMRADLARELPGNSGGQSERLAVSDAQIDAFFAVRNVNVSSFLDSPTGYTPLQGWGSQQPGDLNPWPTKVLSFLAHEGGWTFLDGGELNLGMVRDSTLNATNNFQMFSETFEKAIFRGHESWGITMDLCPDGARAATTDTTGLCATGS